MLTGLFQAMLITSLAGACLAAVITLARPVTKRVFGYAWHYYIWLAVLAVMLLPVQFRLPARMEPAPVTIPQTVQNVQRTAAGQANDAGNAPQAVQDAPKANLLQRAAALAGGIAADRGQLLALLWMAGALALFSAYSISYVRLLIKMRKNAAVIACPELSAYTSKNITVRRWAAVSSPFMAGIVKPTLVLPARELTPEQLDNILRHEMTHCRRHDILYKWFAEFVKCLHWFNPVIWYVAQQIRIECEISCDMAVVNQMNREEEMRYIDTILALLPTGKSKQSPFTTQMASGKKILKRRFTMIKNRRRTGRFMSAVSIVLAAALLSTTVLASGVLSGLTEENYTVEITNNSETLELVNKPFIENGEVYLPLRETFEKAGVLEHAGSSISWEDGAVSVILTPGAGNEEMVSYGFDLQINETAFTCGIVRESLTQMDTLNRAEAMYYPPVLKGSVTYIPYELMDRMLNHRYNNSWDIEYTVFDTDGTDRTLDIIKNLPRTLCNMEARLLSPDYEEEQTACYEVVRTFFDLLPAGDIQNMKAYCTSEFAESAFSEHAFLGYSTGTMWSVYSVDLYADGNYRVTGSFYPNNDATDEEAMLVFSAVVKIQADGRALIDDMIIEA